MKGIVMPDYNKSIVNLMSSIGASFGAKMMYPSLKVLPSSELKNAENVILLVIDGLGYEYLKEQKGSFLAKHTRGKITSVFPATTTSAIPTFLTGVAPQQHGLTGWHMFLKEVGGIVTFLPYYLRGSYISLRGVVDVGNILSEKGFFEKIKTKSKSIYVAWDEIKDSPFNLYYSRNSKVFGYKNLAGFFRQIQRAVFHGKKRKYIHAYWPGFDGYSHEHGHLSREAKVHFEEIDKRMKSFVEKIKGTNTALIVTADHGFVDTPRSKEIWLQNHPRLKECLSMPLSGDSRVAYCYVRKNKVNDFERYVRKRMSKYCYMIKSKELIRRGFYGKFKPNRKLLDRIGDYTLISKDNYIIKDLVLREKKKGNLGHHSGMSSREMFVPLIVIKC